MQLRQLLVVIDPSHPSQPALQRAHWLARATLAKVELLLCEYNSALSHSLIFDSDTLTSARAAMLASLHAELEAMAAPLREEGLQVSVQVRWGKPLEQVILQRVAELQPDLLLKSSHQHHNLKQRLLGNSSWQLLRHCPVPLWLVQHGEWQCRQLCAALDPLHADDKPAALDQQLIATAQLLSDTLGIQPHYLHSYAPVPQSLLFDSALVEDYAHYRQLCATQHRAAFEQLLANAGVPRNQAQLREGFAEEEIARFVREEQIDLLLMGAIARGHLANALLGNTAERVLESVECDVLILKAPPATADPAPGK